MKTPLTPRFFRGAALCLIWPVASRLTPVMPVSRRIFNRFAPSGCGFRFRARRGRSLFGFAARWSCRLGAGTELPLQRASRVAQIPVPHPMKNVTDTVPTVYEQMVSRGVSRRDFLKFCAWMGASWFGKSGDGADREGDRDERRFGGVAPLAQCTCCSESFLCSSHPIVADILLDKISSLDYTETLQAAAGHQAEEILQDVMKKHKGEDLMLC